MPTYGYHCPACGHEFEKMQKMSDASMASCPECGTESQRQISGGAGIVFKGSGFYETDYKRSAEPKKDEGTSAKDTPAPEKTEKTESKKPAAGPAKKDTDS